MHKRWLTDIIHLLIFDVHDFPETILFTDTVLFFACYGIVDFPNTVLLIFKIKYCLFLFCFVDFNFVFETRFVHFSVLFIDFYSIVPFQDTVLFTSRHNVVHFWDTVLFLFQTQYCSLIFWIFQICCYYWYY